MKKYSRTLLIIFILAIAVFLVFYYLNKDSKKNALSNVISVSVTPHYNFKSHKAEELSVSAFELRKDADYGQAIHLYNQAVEIEQDNPKLYFDLAECYAKNNELKKAVTAMNSAIDLDSTYSVFYSNRGLYYYQLYEDQKAITDLEKAVQLDRKSPVCYYNLSLAYYSAKMREKACNAFAQAKVIGLNTNEVKNQNEFIKLQELCKQ